MLTRFSHLRSLSLAVFLCVLALASFTASTGYADCPPASTLGGWAKGSTVNVYIEP